MTFACMNNYRGLGVGIMKKILLVSVMILLIIVIGIFMFTGFHEVQTTDLPKDVPIINGKIVSAKTFRSDGLQRGIEIEVETNLSLQEAAKYYSDEFAKRDIVLGTLPTFQGNAREIENSTEAHAIVETRSHQQVVVSIRKEPRLTLVTIQVLGNSVLFLPS